MDEEPVEILVRLAESGEIDPWNIDIVEVTDRFLSELDRIQKLDLRISGRTLFFASTLLRILQKIENDMGRVRKERWGPRTIDLDILLYGQEIIAEDDLIIPHPELHKRRFVLVPMCEIAPYAIHPSYGISMMGLLNRLEDLNAVELLTMGPSICR